MRYLFEENKKAEEAEALSKLRLKQKNRFLAFIGEAEDETDSEQEPENEEQEKQKEQKKAVSFRTPYEGAAAAQPMQLSKAWFPKEFEDIKAAVKIDTSVKAGSQPEKSHQQLKESPLGLTSVSMKQVHYPEMKQLPKTARNKFGQWKWSDKQEESKMEGYRSKLQAINTRGAPNAW